MEDTKTCTEKLDLMMGKGCSDAMARFSIQVKQKKAGIISIEELNHFFEVAHQNENDLISNL